MMSISVFCRLHSGGMLVSKETNAILAKRSYSYMQTSEHACLLYLAPDLSAVPLFVS